MDYKYIEQLLERYWECQTTLEEEAILRNFFAQSDIPARLLPYAGLFQAEEHMANEHLSDDFDQRVMKAIEEKEVETTAHVVAMNSSAIIHQRQVVISFFCVDIKRGLEYQCGNYGIVVGHIGPVSISFRYCLEFKAGTESLDEYVVYLLGNLAVIVVCTDIVSLEGNSAGVLEGFLDRSKHQQRG